MGVKEKTIALTWLFCYSGSEFEIFAAPQRKPVSPNSFSYQMLAMGQSIIYSVTSALACRYLSSLAVLPLHVKISWVFFIVSEISCNLRRQTKDLIVMARINVFFAVGYNNKPFLVPLKYYTKRKKSHHRSLTGTSMSWRYLDVCIIPLCVILNENLS